MNRIPCLMKIKPGMKPEFLRRWGAPWAEIYPALEKCGISNMSVWRVDDFAFGYCECAARTPDDGARAQLERWRDYMRDCVDYIAEPGEMRLMYHDIGVVRADKSLIRHRVFGTILKPGCAEEYKARHDKLVEARGDNITEGPESNFTIWCAHDKYIFGYCELVKSFDREPTEAERAATIAWETRQLEIMDWLTDDVDWITGESHPHIERVFAQ